MKLNKFVILSMLGSFALPIIAEDAKETKHEVVAEAAAEATKNAPAKVAKKAKKHAKKAKKHAKKHHSVECMAPALPTKPTMMSSVPAMLQSNMDVKIGGYVNATMNYDMNGFGGDYLTASEIPYDNGTPANKKKQDFSMHAKQTRLNLTALSQTAMGAFKAFIQADFFGNKDVANHATPGVDTNPSQPIRLRHAYGQLGGFLVGQTTSLFNDYHTIPMIDFAGHFGGGLRTMQARYTFSMDNGFSIAAGLEQGKANGIDSTGVAIKEELRENKLPDFTTKTMFDWGCGSVDFRTVLSKMSFKKTTTTSNSVSKLGWGIGSNLKVNTMKDSYFVGMVNYGSGIGRYILEHDGQSLVWDGADKMKAQKMLETGFGYRHAITESWAVGTGYSQSRVTKTALRADNNSDVKTLDRMFFNVTWSPVQDLDIGLEYAQARKKSMSTTALKEQKGVRRRMVMGVQYKF